VVRTMTDHDLSVAKDIGALQSDMRTVKHDVGNVSTKLDAISMQISGITNQQSRGLGFFAGAAFIIATFGAVLIAIAKFAFAGVGLGGPHS
jgi:hypothetical protein